MEQWQAGHSARLAAFVADVGDSPYDLDEYEPLLGLIVPRLAEGPAPNPPVWVRRPEERTSESAALDQDSFDLLDGLMAWYAETLLQAWPHSVIDLGRLYGKTTGTGTNEFCVVGFDTQVPLVDAPETAEALFMGRRTSPAQLVSASKWFIQVDQERRMRSLRRGRSAATRSDKALLWGTRTEIYEMIFIESERDLTTGQWETGVGFDDPLYDLLTEASRSALIALLAEDHADVLEVDTDQIGIRSKRKPNLRRIRKTVIQWLWPLLQANPPSRIG